MNTTKTRAEKMLSFIVENANAGRTVYLHTALRITSIKRKHLPQVRVHNGALEIQCGKRWIDYTWVNKLTAA